MSDVERLAELLYEMWATTGRKLGATETEMRAASRGDAATLIAHGVRIPSSPTAPSTNWANERVGVRGAGVVENKP